MKKTLIIVLSIIAIIAVVLIYIFTRHTHTFTEPTCTTAGICECGETQGEPIGHTWVDADCSTAKTCSVCNTTEGTPLEHKWLDATIEAPKTCELCGLTEGEPLPTQISAEQGEGEEPVIIEEAAEETVTDGVDSTSTDVILGEGEYKGDEIDIKSFDEATQNVLNRAKELYEAGLLSKEEYDAVVKDATGLNSLVNDLQNSQPGHIDKDVGYGTPSDPSQYGTNPYKDVDLPAHLKGDVVQ